MTSIYNPFQFFAVAIVCFTSLFTTCLQAQQLAFPEAEGYGRFALGGRGGKVLFVTNLNDSGDGSLRKAVDADYPRIIIFRVAGTIELKTKLIINHPYITIAGQTAPGDGICIKNYPLIISADNTVVRFIRVRLGDKAGRLMDGIEISYAKNVIVDHCSLSWTLDEGINTYHGTQNITVQWCLISESLNDSALRKGHGFAASLGGINTSYHHNLFANNAGRNPSIAGEKSNPTINLDFRNNVIFNWKMRRLDGRPESINIINNYYKAGPASKDLSYIVKIQSLDNGNFGKWYIKGNILEDKNKKLKRDGLIIIDDKDKTPNFATINKPVMFGPVFTESATKAFESVLASAGTIRPRRDSLDRRIVSEVRSGKTNFGNGIISSQTDVGGWPKLMSKKPESDIDMDGMPDEWERTYNLNGVNDLQSDLDLDGDGYTNIEEYLNNTNPHKKS
tara:strand:- start:621 stop:1967 length:1347 start_codon:yes stop_codon:yes gene_type:complete